jgi:general secretion pathway protein F
MTTMFRYEARGPTGRLERGVVDAPSRAAALERLRQRKLTPVDIKQSNGNSSGVARLTNVAARDLSRTLAQLLRAGLSLAQALKFASDELEGAAAGAAARMKDAAERGDRPSSALAEYAGAEARLLRGVVQAGEASGRLVEALDVAADAFEHAAALRGRIGGALIYPAFVIIATLATLACFLILVVPSLGQAFNGVEDRLPPSTRALMNLSTWLQSNGAITALVIAAVVGLVAISPGAQQAIARLVDRLLASPAGLGIATRLDFATFASLASLSLQAGVPAAPAFEAALDSVRSPSLRSALARAVAEIRIGERPSQALQRWANPPRSFLQLTHVGEETGRLADALQQASALLASEAEQRLARLGAIAGPAVTLVLGLIVAGVVMSLFLGLLAMSDLAAV